MDLNALTRLPSKVKSKFEEQRIPWVEKRQRVDEANQQVDIHFVAGQGSGLLSLQLYPDPTTAKQRISELVGRLLQREPVNGLGDEAYIVVSERKQAAIIYGRAGNLLFSVNATPQGLAHNVARLVVNSAREE